MRDQVGKKGSVDLIPLIDTPLQIWAIYMIRRVMAKKGSQLIRIIRGF